MSAAACVPEQRALAQVFASLLLREVDERTLGALRRPESSAGFATLGVRVPPPVEGDVEALAAAFFAEVLQPAHGAPLVQSLHEGGQFEGPAAAAVRAIAAAAGLEHDRRAARGTPVDHLGCELLLWNALAERDPAAAAEFARRHLAWAVSPLRRAGTDSFYGQVQHALAGWITALLA